MEIIETVIRLRLFSRLFPVGNGFLKLTFLMLCIQQPDIFQSMYVFLFPTGQDLICVLEAWLPCCEDCPAAGFLDQLQIKAVSLAPGINVRNLVLHRIPSADAHCFQDRVIIPGKTGACLAGHFHSCDSVPEPGKGNRFNVSYTLASSGDTVFHKIFDKIC